MLEHWVQKAFGVPIIAEIAKSPKGECLVSVIPAKAGIQQSQTIIKALDTGFHR